MIIGAKNLPSINPNFVHRILGIVKKFGFNKVMTNKTKDNNKKIKFILSP